MSNIKIKTRKNLALRIIFIPIAFIVAIASGAGNSPSWSEYIEFEDKNLKVVRTDGDIIVSYQDIKKIRVVRCWEHLFRKRIELHCTVWTQHFIPLPNRKEIMQFKDELIKRCPSATFDFNGIE